MREAEPVFLTEIYQYDFKTAASINHNEKGLHRLRGRFKEKEKQISSAAVTADGVTVEQHLCCPDVELLWYGHTKRVGRLWFTFKVNINMSQQ